MAVGALDLPGGVIGQRVLYQALELAVVLRESYGREAALDIDSGWTSDLP